MPFLLGADRHPIQDPTNPVCLGHDSGLLVGKPISQGVPQRQGHLWLELVPAAPSRQAPADASARQDSAHTREAI